MQLHGLRKVVALITIEVHARDVIEHLHHTSAHGVGDFEWSRQLRLYWSREVNECVVKQARGVRLLGSGRSSSSIRHCVYWQLSQPSWLVLAGVLCVHIWVRVPGQQRAAGHHTAHRPVLHGAGVCFVLWQSRQSFGAGWLRHALPLTQSARSSRPHMSASSAWTAVLSF